jgi:hypothetical protein
MSSSVRTSVALASILVVVPTYQVGVSLVRRSSSWPALGLGGFAWRASTLALRPRRTAPLVTHRGWSVIVEDIEAKVAELRSRGVAFEEYDMPGLKSVDEIAHLPPDQVAWFKDPDGNVLSLVQEDA